MSNTQKMIEIRRDIESMKMYLQMRLRLEDWHGVMDAAADIRELEAKLTILGELHEVERHPLD